MVSTSDVLDRHLKSFAECDVDRVVADYSSDAVLFAPSGPLKGPDKIRPLFEALISEFAKPGSSFRMQRDASREITPTFSGLQKQQKIGTNLPPTPLSYGMQDNRAILRCQNHAEALNESTAVSELYPL